MNPDEMRARLAELTAEAERLKAFVDAVERGEHDDEAAIAAGAARLLAPDPPRKGLFGRSAAPTPDTRKDTVRSMQRNSLMLHALNRVNKEIYPEIHQLQFELKIR